VILVGNGQLLFYSILHVKDSLIFVESKSCL